MALNVPKTRKERKRNQILNEGEKKSVNEIIKKELIRRTVSCLSYIVILERCVCVRAAMYVCLSVRQCECNGSLV